MTHFVEEVDYRNELLENAQWAPAYYHINTHGTPTLTYHCTIFGRNVYAHVHYDMNEDSVSGNGWIPGIMDFDFPTPDFLVDDAPPLNQAKTYPAPNGRSDQTIGEERNEKTVFQNLNSSVGGSIMPITIPCHGPRR